MAIPLSLGVPSAAPREPQSLLAGLLDTPVIPASALLDTALLDTALLDTASVGPVIVNLDIDPDLLRSVPAGRYEPVRFHLDCPAGQLDDALALNLPAPLAVFVTGDADAELSGLAETAQVLADAGRIPGLAGGHPNDDIADFLAVLAHTPVGFVARARDAAEVLALLSGTMAALRGDDVRAALRNPEPAKLAALIPEAATAVREVLLGVEVDDPLQVKADLTAAGLG